MTAEVAPIYEQPSLRLATFVIALLIFPTRPRHVPQSAQGLREAHSD
jgi:hypothetical protein